MSFASAIREFNDKRTVRLTVRQCSELIRSLKFAASIGQNEADMLADEGAREMLLEYVRVIGVNCESLEAALAMARDETCGPPAPESPVPKAADPVVDPAELPKRPGDWH